MWSYEFYLDRAGHDPVKEFILSLDKKTRGKVLQTIHILSEFGPTLPFPYSSHVEGKLRELRCHYGNSLYRILYYHDTEGTFILLHAFKKKTAKIPAKELAIARERLVDDQMRNRGL
jgi:phage-related protein